MIHLSASDFFPKRHGRWYNYPIISSPKSQSNLKNIMDQSGSQSGTGQSYPYSLDRYHTSSPTTHTFDESSSANTTNTAKSSALIEAEAFILEKFRPFAYFDKRASVCYVSNQSLLTNYERRPHYSLANDLTLVVAEGRGIFQFQDSDGYTIPVSAMYLPQAAHGGHHRSHAAVVSPAVLLASGYWYTSYSQRHCQLSHPRHGSVWVFFIRDMYLMPIKPPANIDEVGETWCRLTGSRVWHINPIERPPPSLVAYGNQTRQQRNLTFMNLQLHRLLAHADPDQIYLTLKLILHCEVEWDDIQPVACADCNAIRTAPYESYRYHCPLESTLTIYVDVCDLTTQKKSDPSSLVPIRAVCFENRETGVYYLSDYIRRYQVLPAFRTFFEQCFHSSSFSNVRIVFSPKAKELLTFCREDIRRWCKERGCPKFLQTYKNFERKDHSRPEIFNARCWSKSIPDNYNVTVKTETSPTNGPRLGQLIEQMSKKLLKSSGLPRRFALHAAVHFVNTHNMMYDPRSDHQFCSPYTLYTNNASIAACFQTFGCLVSYRESAPDRYRQFPRPGKWGLYIGLRGDRYQVVDLKTQGIDYYSDVEFYPTITPLRHDYPKWQKYPHDYRDTLVESITAVDTTVALLRASSIWPNTWTQHSSVCITNLGDSVAKADSVPSMVYARGMALSLTKFSNWCVWGVPRDDERTHEIREIVRNIPYTLWGRDSTTSQQYRQ